SLPCQRPYVFASSQPGRCPCEDRQPTCDATSKHLPRGVSLGARTPVHGPLSPRRSSRGLPQRLLTLYQRSSVPSSPQAGSFAQRPTIKVLTLDAHNCRVVGFRLLAKTQS